MGGEFKMEKSEMSAGSQHRGAGKDGGLLARGLQESDSKSGHTGWGFSGSVSSVGFCCIQLIVKPDQL